MKSMFGGDPRSPREQLARLAASINHNFPFERPLPGACVVDVAMQLLYELAASYSVRYGYISNIDDMLSSRSKRVFSYLIDENNTYINGYVAVGEDGEISFKNIIDSRSDDYSYSCYVSRSGDVYASILFSDFHGDGDHKHIILCSDDGVEFTLSEQGYTLDEVTDWTEVDIEAANSLLRDYTANWEKSKARPMCAHPVVLSTPIERQPALIAWGEHSSGEPSLGSMYLFKLNPSVVPNGWRVVNDGDA